VLRVIDNPEMTETAASIVKALRLTGLCGFDFVIEAETGRAHLVELNPRATPTAHLLTADGADPLRSLAAALRRQAAPRRRTPYADGLVALFPHEVQRDPASEYLATAHHDVPVNAQDFVAKAGHRPGGRVRRDLRAASVT
jgi:predicted ATP-grasp superfamily ATP-dependent carboligase